MITLCRLPRALLIGCAALLATIAASPSVGAQPGNTECADSGMTLTGQQAFDQFCALCHVAEKLSRAFLVSSDPHQTERELALFLDQHGACPHDRHEAIAAYLRHLSGK